MSFVWVAGRMLEYGPARPARGDPGGRDAVR